ncbi:uncharacterized protein LOC114398680 [Glycine soja]|uniref:uncharacterized protein LOC114398680 n=1 Tax=Glycine soja TaxID=3848 RepID=UPI00103C8206|nr:uncharacterized protein LOC114398680 [Glycine soja]
MTVLDESMGCMLRQHNESGKREWVVYYLRKKFTTYEMNYSLLERTCCALVWVAHRLRQYMQSHTTWLVSKMDPVKYIFEKPTLTGWIAQWQEGVEDEDRDKWIVWFDGASNTLDHGVGAVLVTPNNQCIPFTAKLGFNCINNMVEYEACALGIQATIEFNVKLLKVYGDSTLVIHQLKGEW